MLISGAHTTHHRHAPLRPLGSSPHTARTHRVTTCPRQTRPQCDSTCNSPSCVILPCAMHQDHASTVATPPPHSPPSSLVGGRDQNHVEIYTCHPVLLISLPPSPPSHFRDFLKSTSRYLQAQPTAHTQPRPTTPRDTPHHTHHASHVHSRRAGQPVSRLRLVEPEFG